MKNLFKSLYDVFVSNYLFLNANLSEKDRVEITSSVQGL